MNKTIIIGNVGKDATTKEVGTRTVLNVNVGVSKKYMKDGKQVEQTTWFDVAYWMQKKESADKLAAYILKGSKIACEGEIGARAYISTSNNEAIGILVLNASNVEIISSTKSKDSTPVAAPTEQSYTTAPGEDDDLPF